MQKKTDRYWTNFEGTKAKQLITAQSAQWKQRPLLEYIVLVSKIARD